MNSSARPWPVAMAHDRDGAQLTLLPPLGDEPPVLLVHVLDANLRERAQRRAAADGGAGVLCVDVYPHQATAAYDHRGGGQRFHRLAYCVRGQVFALDDELRAVSVDLVLRGIDEGSAHGLAARWRAVQNWCGELGWRRLLAAQPGQGALHDDRQAKASGVHHAGLSEHRQQCGRPCHGVSGRQPGGLPRGEQVRTALGGLLSGVRKVADDREHGALHGIAYGAVGGR